MHAIIIFDMLLNNHIDEPYNKIFNGDEVPLLNKPLVKSTLTEKIKNYDFTDFVENLQNEKFNKKPSNLKANKKLLKESKNKIT
jgi:hypothetical protein